MCSRGREWIRYVHRETQGHLELATRGTTAADILLAAAFFKLLCVAFCRPFSAFDPNRAVVAF